MGDNKVLIPILLRSALLIFEIFLTSKNKKQWLKHGLQQIFVLMMQNAL